MSTDFVKVTINGKDFQVAKGARLIDVCRDNGFDIPSFCYYSDLAHVSRAHRKDAEAANVLHDHLH
jgi:predicted molibdopterin-dependent oxidoreductase YjgC